MIKPSVLLNVVLAVALVVVSARLMSSGGETAGKPVADSADVVYGNIMGRTSVRSYLDKPVEDSKIEKLLHAGMAAPTAVNTQPWHFVVIRDRNTLDRIAELTPNAGMAKEAPLAIVVCGNMVNEKEDIVRMFWTQDVSAATENILLQAHAMGLGAVWTGTYPDKKRCDAISGLLNMPEHIIPFCTIVIGYPKGEQTPKDKWKPENVTYEAF
ncbi:MAG: nitroreductase family protein [Bacteroidaceae bacterium]|nr:nitroreductase family protein [Bacteroidaceae bacterium]